MSGAEGRAEIECDERERVLWMRNEVTDGDDMSRRDQESALGFCIKFSQFDTDIPEINRLRKCVGESWVAVAKTALC